MPPDQMPIDPQQPKTTPPVTTPAPPAPRLVKCSGCSDAYPADAFNVKLRGIAEPVSFRMVRDKRVADGYDERGNKQDRVVAVCSSCDGAGDHGLVWGVTQPHYGAQWHNLPEDARREAMDALHDGRPA